MMEYGMLGHSLGLQQQQDLEPLPAFYPMDEHKDISLKALLDLADYCLFDHEDENKNTRNSSMLNPTPLNVAACYHIDHNAVAASNATSQAYSKNVVPMQTGNQMQPTMEQPTVTNEENVPTIPSTTSRQCPAKKRRREEPRVDKSNEAVNNNDHSRPKQAGLWAERFRDLCLYREEHGNCRVPYIYKENLPLARWVKRQRFQYKLMKEGKPSAMTDERVKALEELGFAWDIQGASWGESLDELKKYRSIYMHCCVPSNDSENPQLASWVKYQRRQYKLRMEGKASVMTPQRVRDLEAVGFEWFVRSTKKQRTI
jgi:hypothetical protein